MRKSKFVLSLFKKLSQKDNLLKGENAVKISNAFLFWFARDHFTVVELLKSRGVQTVLEK